MDMPQLPDWQSYPDRCQHGHPWPPGQVVIGWLPCQCASDEPGAGHRTVGCTAPGCRSVWYSPPHDRARAVRLRAQDGDEMDLEVCQFNPEHTAARVPSARILDYGPEGFMPACTDCAASFEADT